MLVDRHGDDHVSIPRMSSPLFLTPLSHFSYLPIFRLLTEISLVVVDQPSTKITKDFLNFGTLPAAQNSTLVTVYTPGMVRGPIADPYMVPTGAVAGDVDSGAVIEIPFKRNRI